ncbi:amidase [Actinospongicola halichondriae]|uniref:amidase n=1 Tax=Actinospongicola halichondriae TaxID=3236844 RepID=UPI003D3E9760
MSVFLVRTDPPPGDGPTVAVKDLIDMEGLPTTCASRPVTERAVPATVDAECVANVRTNGGRIVGKTNLHELAFGGTGVNPYTGTPTNPLDPTRIPGGSSSGSAVAVATGEADIALGTDTGGSIRTPSACCGTVGLKTTKGRVSLAGIHPLAPSLDVVGPMATTVDGVVRGMALLEAGFTPADDPAPVLGRFRVPGADPDIEAALDRALATAEMTVEPSELPGWMDAYDAATVVAFVEALEVNADLVRDHADQLDPAVRDRFERSKTFTPEQMTQARVVAEQWRAEVDRALDRTPVVALVGMVGAPPPLSDPLSVDTRLANVSLNLSGHPAIVVPVPWRSDLPASLQLFGRHGSEELLVRTASVIEAAVAS